VSVFSASVWDGQERFCNQLRFQQRAVRVAVKFAENIEKRGLADTYAERSQ